MNMGVLLPFQGHSKANLDSIHPTPNPGVLPLTLKLNNPVMYQCVNN